MVRGGATKEEDSITHPGNLMLYVFLLSVLGTHLARAWRRLGFGPDPNGFLSFHVQTLIRSFEE